MGLWEKARPPKADAKTRKNPTLIPSPLGGALGRGSKARQSFPTRSCPQIPVFFDFREPKFPFINAISEPTQATRNQNCKIQPMPTAETSNALPNLWDFTKAGTDDLDQLVYASNLLGGDPRITNFGGGNTSVKTTTND